MKTKQSVIFGFSMIMIAAIFTLAGCDNLANTEHTHDYSVPTGNREFVSNEFDVLGDWEEFIPSTETAEGQGRNTAAKRIYIESVEYECSTGDGERISKMESTDFYLSEEKAIMDVYKAIPKGRTINPDGSFRDKSPEELEDAEWGGWEATGKTKWVRSGNEYGIPVTNGFEREIMEEVRYKKTDTDKTSPSAPRWVATATAERAIAATTALSARTPIVADIDMVAIIKGNNGVHMGVNQGMQDGGIPAIRSALVLSSRQAEKLQSFLNDSTAATENTAMKDDLTTFRWAEEIIRTGIKTLPTTYLGDIDAQRELVLGIMGWDDAQKTDFQAYQALNYLMTVDPAVSESADLMAEWFTKFWARFETVDMGVARNTYGNSSIYGLGANPSSTATSLENLLVTAGVGRLTERWGISTDAAQQTQLKDFVTALVRQFGADTVEFQAMIDSMDKANLSGVEENYASIPNVNIKDLEVATPELSQATPLQTQGVRLASFDAGVPLDAIKPGAYGNAYSGNTTNNAIANAKPPYTAYSGGASCFATDPKTIAG